MLWMLLGGWLAAGLGMYSGGRVDWAQADLRRAERVRVVLIDGGFAASVDGAEAVFGCSGLYPFCRALESRAGNGGLKEVRADLDYLSVDKGNVLLAAEFDDEATGERVVMRYPQDLVDDQAARVERQAGGWLRVWVYLRHVFFTAFFLLLLLRVYVFGVEKLTGLKGGSLN